MDDQSSYVHVRISSSYDKKPDKKHSLGFKLYFRLFFAPSSVSYKTEMVIPLSILSIFLALLVLENSYFRFGGLLDISCLLLHHQISHTLHVTLRPLPKMMSANNKTTSPFFLEKNMRGLI